MAPKTNCNATKLTSIVSWMQRSRTAWNIKDLEKQLPAVASINGMQVKDYLQALSDDSKIRVEKIGSGNWYWSFASEALNTQRTNLSAAQANHTKQSSLNEELKQKIADARAAREHEENDSTACQGRGAGDSRESLNERRADVEGDLLILRKEVAAYKDSDPTEIERLKGEGENAKVEAGNVTDDIYCMESYFAGRLGVDEQDMKALRETYYGEELDVDEGMLREL